MIFSTGRLLRFLSLYFLGRLLVNNKCGLLLEVARCMYVAGQLEAPFSRDSRVSPPRVNPGLPLTLCGGFGGWWKMRAHLFVETARIRGPAAPSLPRYIMMLVR